MTTAAAVKERPILFTGAMVRALLEGRKTQTRRVLKYQPHHDWTEVKAGPGSNVDGPYVASFRAYPGGGSARHGICECPYGKPGDRLWVRETWGYNGTDALNSTGYQYKADGGWLEIAKWKPSIFMHRDASRITLEITGVRVERVRDISEADAVAEGLEFRGGWWSGSNHSVKGTPKVFPNARDAFFDLFYNLRKRADPNENPWVWVLEFKRVEARA